MVKMHTLKWATHKQEDIYNCRDSPKGLRGLSPTLGSPALKSCTEELKTENVCLLRPVGLIFRRARALWETETQLLKDTHEISHTPGPREEEVI